MEAMLYFALFVGIVVVLVWGFYCHGWNKKEVIQEENYTKALIALCLNGLYGKFSLKEGSKMENELKVGDSVKVFGPSLYGLDIYDGVRGKIVKEENDGFLVGINEGLYKFHPRQIEKVVLKKPRRIWVSNIQLSALASSAGGVRDICVSTSKYLVNDVEFIEVLPVDNPPLKTFTRSRREWWINLYTNTNSPYAHDSKESADAAAGSQIEECIRVREVLDES